MPHLSLQTRIHPVLALAFLWAVVILAGALTYDPTTQEWRPQRFGQWLIRLATIGLVILGFALPHLGTLRDRVRRWRAARQTPALERQPR